MNLESKIKKSKKIISKALKLFNYDSLAVAWSGHKDSTVLLHLCKTVYRDEKIKAFLNITGKDFPEALEFVDNLSRDWGVEVIKVKKSDKIKAIETGISKFGIKAYISAIRREENEARSRETYISKRETHMRIHPILDFTEKDIWEYIKKFNVPYLKLYDEGFRSLGEKTNTRKSGEGHAERSGRLKSKEKLMFALREMGYW